MFDIIRIRHRFDFLGLRLACRQQISEKGGSSRRALPFLYVLDENIVGENLCSSLSVWRLGLDRFH